MNFPWFKRYGVFFIPSTLMAWLILGAAVVYSIYVFIDIDSTSHSVSDTLISFAFNLLIIGAVYSTVGYLTSREW